MGLVSTGTLLTARQMAKLRYPFPILGIDDPSIDLKGSFKIAAKAHNFDDENGFSVRRTGIYVQHLDAEFLRHLGRDPVFRHGRVRTGHWY